MTFQKWTQLVKEKWSCPGYCPAYLINPNKLFIFYVVLNFEKSTDLRPVVTLLCVCSLLNETAGNGTSQKVDGNDHIVCLTPDPSCMLCGLSILSLLSVAFTGNKCPWMAASRLNVDSSQLTVYLQSAPDSRSW